MPIDPSIVPTALKGFNTPFERLNKQMEAEQTRSLNAARDAETAKLTRAAAEQEALQRIVQESGGDLSEATLNKITQVAPALGVKFRGDLIEQRKQLTDATKAEMEVQAKQTEWGRSLLLAAKANPAMWPQIRAMAISGGGDIGTLVQGTPQFDPAVVDALLQTGLQAKDHIEQNLALMEAFRKGDMRYAVGAMAKILPSLDPDEANELAQAALFSGMPKPMLDAVLKDPQAFAQTETERQEGADRDATREQQARLAASDDARMAATAAETARHNRVMEGQGATRLSRETGGNSKSQAELIDAVMANPAIYAGLTPSVKSAIAGELAKRGFRGFTDGSGGKPSTGQQKRALNFFNRAKQSDDELRGLESAVAGMGLAGQTRMQYAPNFLQSQTGQAYTAAQRAFTEARLRKDSGAAIPEHEFENDRRTYFAQPGDSNETLAQKARQRAAVLASLAFEAGPAFPEFFGEDAPAMMDDYRQRSATREKKASPSPDGAVIEVQAPNGKIYTFKDQASANEFKRRTGIR